MEVQIKNMYNRKISFPVGYVSLSCDDTTFSVDSLLKKDIKMVSYIDDLPCTSCGIRKLNKWIATVDCLDRDLPYIIIVRSSDKELLFKSIDTMQLSRPLMFYDTPVFGQKNKLEEVVARNKTFLLNKENRIILVGEPFYNKKLFSLYKRTILYYKKKYAQL